MPFPLERRTPRIRSPKTLAQLSIWRGELGISDLNVQLKLYKNKMDSKVIKSHQCSLERSHTTAFIKLNSEF